MALKCRSPGNCMCEQSLRIANSSSKAVLDKKFREATASDRVAHLTIV